MSRSLTRKDFLMLTAASAGTAFAAACGSSNSNGGGSGGTTGSGGSASGGTTGSGGSGSGGTTGSGGTSASGGATGSGGTSASGGTTGSGGTSASGGATGSGGTSASGGTTGSGGTSASGGATGSGGSAPGGSSGTGGATGNGGAGGAGGGGGGAMCTADVVAAISCPHDPPHTLTIPKADVDAAMPNKTFTLTMAANHTHTIMMMAADWTKLKSGGTVFKFVEATGSNQDHCVVLSCGTVDAATAAGAQCGGTAPGDGNDVMCATPWP